jgi:hypothetical protein
MDFIEKPFNVEDLKLRIEKIFWNLDHKEARLV